MTSGTGYFLTASDSHDVPVRIRGDVDEATPSATGQIIAAMARTAILTGDHDLERRAWKLPKQRSDVPSINITVRRESSTLAHYCSRRSNW